MHSLIIGQTMSGKTTLARAIAAKVKLRGRGVIVLDPFKSRAWGADFVTNDADDFLKIVWHNKGCAVFVDEAGDTVGRYSEAMNKLATRGRHFGHRCYFITQRAKSISTTIRTQCVDLYTFLQSQADIKDLANEYVCDDLLDAHTLNKGEFLYTTRGLKKCHRGRIDFTTQAINFA